MTDLTAQPRPAVLNRPHGFRATYEAGCRCDDCKLAIQRRIVQVERIEKAKSKKVRKKRTPREPKLEPYVFKF